MKESFSGCNSEPLFINLHNVNDCYLHPNKQKVKNMRKKSLYEHTLVNGIPLHDAHKMYILHFIQYNNQIGFEKLIKTEKTKHTEYFRRMNTYKANLSMVH